MTVEVESSARIHLGFYNMYNDGVAYGSIGVAVTEPIVRVRVKPSDKLVVDNKSGIPVDDVVSNVINKLRCDNVQIEVLEAIPRHVGLGSTTQLSLSLGYAIANLKGLKISIRELAVKLGRGVNSGIGVAAFESGGFIVDSGRYTSNGKVYPPKTPYDIPHVVFRHKLPRDWYFIILLPKGIKGLSEREERSIMESPEPLPQDIQYELYKTLVLHLIPSVLRNDIVTFGKAVTKIQYIVGMYFSKYQGGIFCCDEVDYLVHSLLELGAYGAGQSSWGPTTYGIVKSISRARRLLRKVLERASSKSLDVEAVELRLKCYRQ